MRWVFSGARSGVTTDADVLAPLVAHQILTPAKAVEVEAELATVTRAGTRITKDVAVELAHGKGTRRGAASAAHDVPVVGPGVGGQPAVADRDLEMQPAVVQIAAGAPEGSQLGQAGRC